MNQFICDICGKAHEIYFSQTLLEPDLLYKMSKSERLKRVIHSGNFYLIDRSTILTKGNLFIKIRDCNEYMHWELWVKLEKSEFDKLMKNTKPILRGELFSEIPYYRNSIETEVELIFDLLDSKEIYPQIELINNQTEIEQDYHAGISYNKVINWMKNIYHGPS